MRNFQRPEVIVSGLGVVSAVGQGKTAFVSALKDGCHKFDVMRREGRQKDTDFIGAELSPLSLPERFSKRVLRTTSLSGIAALSVIDEAWQEAMLDDVDPMRIGLVIGGSNFQQRELVQLHERYAEKPTFIRPTYAVNFMDTDLCGLCTEQFGIRGFACSVGGASASGQMAVIQAAQAVQSGIVDVCIAVGALMDLSFWECIALRNMGAMGSEKYANSPELACRPFDQLRDGFIFGEACAAVVVERSDAISRSGIEPYAKLAAWAVSIDGNRGPDPSLDGEVSVIKKTLHQAGLTSSEINYVNPHGTASYLGDETELNALRQCGLEGARINTTKSIVGHSLTAAGTLELAATLLQMKESFVHPSLNLDKPIDEGFAWVLNVKEQTSIATALNLSFGFGGFNTAVCVSKQ